MPAEHYRPDGLYQGYYCLHCGSAGANMLGQSAFSDHGPGHCKPNPELVEQIRSLNTVEAQAKREFVRGLHGTPNPKTKTVIWSYTPRSSK